MIIVPRKAQISLLPFDTQNILVGFSNFLQMFVAGFTFNVALCSRSLFSTPCFSPYLEGAEAGYLEQNTREKESPLNCSKFIFIPFCLKNCGFNIANMLWGKKRKKKSPSACCTLVPGGARLCSSA